MSRLVLKEFGIGFNTLKLQVKLLYSYTPEVGTRQEVQKLESENLNLCNFRLFEMEINEMVRGLGIADFILY